jgi:hypothetical protein
VPWLIYIVLTASSVALELILFSLAHANAQNNTENQETIRV